MRIDACMCVYVHIIVYTCLYLCIYPPRPCASRRVEAPTKQQTLQTLKPPNKPQGGGFTLPLPPPRRQQPPSTSYSQNTFGALDTSKSVVKMSISCLWAHLGPIKVVMLTTLAQKSIILTILMPRSRHLDDFSMKRGATGIYL